MIVCLSRYLGFCYKTCSLVFADLVFADHRKAELVGVFYLKPRGKTLEDSPLHTTAHFLVFSFTMRTGYVNTLRKSV